MFTPNQRGILAILAGEPDGEFSMSDLGRALGKQPGVFQRGLNSLEEQGFVTSHRESNRRLFRFNTSHPLGREVARIAIGADSPLPPETYTDSPVGTSRQVAEPREIRKLWRTGWRADRRTRLTARRGRGRGGR